MLKKILIANRGEIACRIIRSLKKMGISSVAIYSKADESATHVLEADEAVCVGESPAKESYLRTDKILEVAKQLNVDAIHPGYGFLSENASFAQECEDNGIIFIGPTCTQLVEFGLKHRARELAEEFNVPLVKGTPLLANVEEALATAETVGYPVMLKSTAGGGGIGMCICNNKEELADGYETTLRLSKNNFKDSGLFLEKYIKDGRHVEVQVFGDGNGNVAILGERDCSVQRRNQKIIEESPAPNLPEKTRKLLHESAKRLAEGVKYRSAGTVEFIYDQANDNFYFLEVNTRLQVEHGVTEEVFGVDLVEWMIDLAGGKVPFEIGKDYQPKGHAIEFRVYAEDPNKDFRPSSGLITLAEFPEDIRCDKWIKTGTEVSSFYDPLLAKIIIHTNSRNETIEKSKSVLANSKIYGFETNMILLQDVLEMSQFVSGDVSTSMLKGSVYNAPTFEVVKPGAFTTIQDYPARIGYWDVGVPPSGPMDNYSFRLANKIVGNADNAAAIEMTLLGAGFKFNVDAAIALCGGDFVFKINKQPAQMNKAIAIKKGDVIDVGSSKLGQRCYLSIRGGIDVPQYLGSRSTFSLGGFGGHQGRTLKVGDIIHIGDFIGSDIIEIDKSAIKPMTNSWEVSVLYGPQGAPDYITDEGIKEFFDATWEVHYNSSRTGVRLVGPDPKWARADGGEAGLHPSNLHDNAYALGSLDITGDMPVILGCDGPSLGGFVCPATIVLADMYKIGQFKSGDKIKFNVITHDCAENLLKAQEKQLANPTVANTDDVQLELDTLESPIIEKISNGNAFDDVLFRQDGDSNVLIEFGDPKLDMRQRFKVHTYMLKLKGENLNGIVDITPGVRSLQVHFNPSVLSRKDLMDKLIDLLKSLAENKATRVSTRTLYLPLSWDDPATRLAIEKYVTTVRPDAPWCCPNNIEFIKRINGLDSIDEVAKIVFGSDYVVIGLGDVYLGAPVAIPYDPRMKLVTTKYNPARTWTAENSVGIGGAYMCVYGMEGPGGYQFVGRTLQMWNRFNVTEEFKQGYPYLLRFFDTVKYFPVSPDELLQIRKDFINGQYHIRIEENHFDIEEYEAFLKQNEESIEAFESKRNNAFAEEKQRWIDNGQFTFKSHVEEAVESDYVLADAESGIYSPVSGYLWKMLVNVGDKVKEGDTLAILESMKMEISITAECDSTVSKILLESKEIKSGQCLFAMKE